MKRFLISFTIITLIVIPQFATAQLEQILSYVVTDEAAMVESLDAWFACKDSNFGQTSFLVSTIANGSDPTTHYLVLVYPGYANYQAAMDGVVKSEEFSRLESRISEIATMNSESLYTHVLNNGKSEKTGEFQYLINVNVTGSGSEYAAAIKELMNSDIGKKVPGIFKLNTGLSGTESSHLVILSAPSFATLNEYLAGFLFRKQRLGKFSVQGR